MSHLGLAPVVFVLATASAVSAQSSVTAAVNAPATLTCNASGDVTVSLSRVDAIDQPAEVVLVLDDSGSVSDAEFDHQRAFAAAMVNALNLGPAAIRVGIVTSSTLGDQLSGRVVADLSDNRPSLLSVIQTAAQRRGNGCVYCGLFTAAKTVLGAASVRQGVPQVVIQLLDGESLDGVSFLPSLVTSISARIIAIGVDAAVTPSPTLEFRTLTAGTPWLGFESPLFTGLSDLVVPVTKALLAEVYGGETLATDAVLTLQVDSSLAVSDAAATLGSVIASGNQLRWAIPAVPAGTSTLSLSLRAGEGSQIRSLFSSASYQDAEGNAVAIPNPTVTMFGCGDGALLEQIAQLTAQVAAVTDANAVLQTDYNNALARIAALETSVSALEVKLAGASAVMAAHEARIAALEADIAAFVIKVNDLVSALDASSRDAARKNALIASAVNLVQENLRQAFRNPAFVIPGGIPELQLHALTNAVIGLNLGRREGLYQALNGK